MLVLVYFALIVSVALALPQDSSKVDVECPEIIPGPGLPSLASLNLTSQDLCKSPQEFMMAQYGYIDEKLLGDLPKEDSHVARQVNQSLSPRVILRTATTIFGPLETHPASSNKAWARGSVIPPAQFETSRGMETPLTGCTLNQLAVMSPAEDTGCWIIANCGHRMVGNSPQVRSDIISR
ncbi:hypothetical protein CC1G_09993 [Coprinopsis cinerea okayama7|uniref:Uncharacterized protein n=1 Tax=Coprinopsis cinerea (strain Okayama-7 / 130 / ATCC MYA-4618 / FGSC 9003) TaxID=240176 RepID=A8NDI3_COPC7|nr:hypothetical protein CC1G_09993 [Coprinopsis cinerea okayama7\|eukprot:XP_001832779.2 hypothetical protein CC1G_09993 [Coprinopsis cinerea okayama7\